jgi:hypothetical protein
MTPPNCIKIVYSTNQHSYRVASQHPFFLHTTEVLTSYRGGVLTITRPTIDIKGRHIGYAYQSHLVTIGCFILPYRRMYLLESLRLIRKKAMKISW